MTQQLVVLSFDDEQQAAEALRALRGQQGAGVIHLNDTAVVTKDQAGSVHASGEFSSATEIGAVGGGTLGLMLAFMFPVAGIALGAAGGAAVGALLDKGVDRKFVKEVGDSLQPGTSALFLVFDQANPAVMQVLHPFHGRVIQTTLPPDIEDRLRQAINERTSGDDRMLFR
jgi:uncharacterized membrane protein